MAFFLFSISDAPEIEVEQSWVRTNAGIEAQVSCNVHSEPRAEVSGMVEQAILKKKNVGSKIWEADPSLSDGFLF